MTEERLGLGDPVIRRLQQTFSHEEPATELAAIVQRAARYLQSPDPDDQPPPRRVLTEADLVAAQHRERPRSPWSTPPTRPRCTASSWPPSATATPPKT
jgi:hypothetical protein